MRVYEAFETSERLIDEGLQCEIEFGGKVIAKVWVRPTDPNLNRTYARELTLEAIALKGNGLDDLEPDQDAEILYRIFARTVIVRWEWTDAADKKDPKLRIHPNLKAETREKNFVTLCQRVPKFFEGIQKVARQWSQYRAAHEEDAAGN